MNIEEIVYQLQKKYFRRILLFNLLLLFGLLSVVSLVLSILIYWQVFFGRFLFPAIAGVVFLIVGVNFYQQKNWLKKDWLKYLSRITDQKYPDDISNAISLKKFCDQNNLTGAMARTFRQKIGVSLEKFHPDFSNLRRKVFSLLILLLVSFCWLVFSPHLLFNFIRWYRGKAEEIFQVSPGNIRLDCGSDQNIIINLKTPGLSPVIFLKDNHHWRKVIPAPVSESSFQYTVRNIQKDTFYFGMVAGLKSQVFCLEVVFPPQIAFEEIEYHYPEYTGQKKFISSSSLVRAVVYSRVILKMYSSQKLKKATLITTTQHYPAQLSPDGMRFNVGLVLTASDTYYFQLQTPDDRIYLTEFYNMEVIPDNPPTVEITVPAEDLRAEKLDVVPLLARLEDDFGIKNVELVWRVNSGEWKITPVKQFAVPVKSEILMSEIKLSEYNLRENDRLEYYLRATDNSPTKNFGRSLTYEIEIAGYFSSHQKLTEELKQWQKDLIQEVARQGLLVEDLSEALSSTTTPKSEQFYLWQQQQESINKQIKNLTEQLGDILSFLEKDPLTDFYTYTEFQATQRNLNDLSANNLLRGAKNLSERNLPLAHQELSQALKVLEKLAVFSEDVWQYHQWRSLLDKSDESLKLLDSIQENLAKAPNREKIARELKEIESLLREIEQLLVSANELPEEFVNQPAIKELNFSQEKDLLQKLNEQITAGDFAGVENLLKQLRQELLQLKETLARSGESIQLRDTAGKTLQKYQQLNQQLEEIIQEQTRLLNLTAELENQRQHYLFRQQEEALKAGTTVFSDLSRTPLNFLKDNKDRLKEFSSQQEKILIRTKNFSDDLNEFSRQTATLPLMALENISEAIKYQKTSKETLDSGETGKSSVAQGQALQKLQDALEMLGEAQKQYAQGQARAGEKTATSLQALKGFSGGRGGITGIRIEPVRLPRPEDFRQPKDFRQEILDALKEKYPANYEKSIKEYYQRLLEQ